MRFAIKTSPQHTTWADMLAVWQAADDIDMFESAWTFDHFYPIFSDPTGPCLEGWITLTALAQATTPAPGRRARDRQPTAIRRCSRTWPPPSTSSPTGGSSSGSARAGTRRSASAYGIDLPPLTERFDRFDEGLRGDHRPADRTRRPTSPAATTSSRDACCEPKPVQRPHPPICIGGRARSARCAAVARWAQHWNCARRRHRATCGHKREVLAATAPTSAATRRRS